VIAADLQINKACSIRSAGRVRAVMQLSSVAVITSDATFSNKRDCKLMMQRGNV
jgi:hypothetical protein